METIRKTILNYIDDKIGYITEGERLGYFMDSLDAIEMVMWLETTYDISISDDDWYTWDKYTVDDIVKYIHGRLHEEIDAVPVKKQLKHIPIPKGISEHFKGKTIEKTFFDNDCYDSSLNKLIIQFTDGEYICVAIDYSDDNYLYDGKLEPLDEDRLSVYGRIKNNEYVYNEHYRNLIEMGVIEPIPNDIAKNEILRRYKEEEQREYNRYLQLKARFENYNPLEQ